MPSEHPILFSGSMVRAILEGRKTQTRRVIKPQPIPQGNIISEIVDARGWWECRPIDFGEDPRGCIPICELKCPYGVPGDLLIPRCTWAVRPEYDLIKPTQLPSGLTVWTYWAGDEKPAWCGKSRPGRFLPRALWYVLPRLRVVGIRVERLQDISEEDAIAEGVERCNDIDLCPAGTWEKENIHIDRFARLWNTINAKRVPWESNPWVWVVEFRKLEKA
jgi:hypothetical protein